MSTCLLSAVVCAHHEQETLETRKHRRDYGRVVGKLFLGLFKKKKKQHKWNDDEQASSLLKRSHRYSSSSAYEDDTETLTNKDNNFTTPQPAPGYREIFSRQSNINLITYSLLALHSVTFDQLVPIFMHLPVQKRDNNPDIKLPLKFAGGFGIGRSRNPFQTPPPSTHPRKRADSERIGLLFTLYGLCGMLIQFLIFPPVARRFGVLNCLRVCTLTFPVAYLLTPFTALLPTPATQQAVMFAIMFLKLCGVIFAFPCSTILLTNSAVSLRILGTLNGVATSVSALGRAAGPAIGGVAFSRGVDAGYVVVPWWTLAALAALGAVPVWWLVEMDGFGAAADSDADESETEVNHDVDVDDEEADKDEDPLPDTNIDDPTPLPSALDDDIVMTGEPDSFAADTDLHALPPSSTARTMKRKRTSTSTTSILDPASVDLHRRMMSPIGMAEGLGPGGGRR